MRTRVRSFGCPFRWTSLLLGLLLVPVGCGEAESSDAAEGEPVAEGVEESARSEDPRRSAPAGSEEPRRSAPAPVRALPAGTLLTFEVTEDVSTATHSEGDAFTLRLVEEVSGTGGGFLPAGTRARGVVTDAQRSRSPDEEALLALQVRSVERNGTPVQFRGSVESASIQTSAGDSGARTAAKIATGTAAGAVVGRILGGDTRSAVAGAVVGAVAGTGVAITTRDGHATLPEGSRLTVRLDQDLVLN